MKPTTVVLITGHPASGKTTLARYLSKKMGLPTICKDDIKEILYDTLGWSTVAWSNKLSIATWSLLYHQVEILLEAHIDHIVESNFDPKYANPHWQRLIQQFDLQLIQVRCESDPAILLERYRERIRLGKRHPGHVDGSDDRAFHKSVQEGSLDWIEVKSERISVNTTELAVEDYASVAKRILEVGSFSSFTRH